MSDSEISSQNKQSSAKLMDAMHKIFAPKKIDDPRNESFWDMLHINLFPHLTIPSFTFIFSVILFIIFIIQLILCGVNMLGKFLEVQHIGFTEIMLLEKSFYIYANEPYRLLSSIFIHNDIP